MNIKLQILSAEESWEHQLSVYQNYHQKYAQFYSPDKFFYHPYLQSKFSEPGLSPNELKNIKDYFVSKIYDEKKLEQGKQFISQQVVSFIEEKNNRLQELPITHPNILTIKLSGAMSGGFYDAVKHSITISPQCVSPNFMPLLLVHEFTHICVDNEIQKRKLPHLAKERIVSRICSEILEFDDHNSVGDKSLDKFLSKENLSSDFLGTLNSIADYLNINQTQAQMHTSRTKQTPRHC